MKKPVKKMMKKDMPAKGSGKNMKATKGAKMKVVARAAKQGMKGMSDY